MIGAILFLVWGLLTRLTLFLQDVGCGVGGPGRNIAMFSGAKITGLNFNKYQISRCEFHTKNAGLEHQCNYVQVRQCSVIILFLCLVISTLVSVIKRQ